MSRKNRPHHFRIELRHLPRHITRAHRAVFWVAVAAASVVSMAPTHLAPSDGLTYMTGRGEAGVISLSDDTTVHVNASTAFLLKDSPDHRVAYLEHGELQVRIHHGRSKPLDIIVHGVRLQDLGTEFDVTCHGDVVTISMTDGKVRVIELKPDGSQSDPIDTTEGTPHRDPAFLTAGDLVRLDIHDGVVMLSRDRNNLPEARRRSSWIDGKLEAGSERLDEVVWQLNAHNRIQLVIQDPTVAQIRVGGTYSLFNVPDFLQTLPESLNLEPVPVRDPGKGQPSTYILRRPPAKTLSTQRH